MMADDEAEMEEAVYDVVVEQVEAQVEAQAGEAQAEAAAGAGSGRGRGVVDAAIVKNREQQEPPTAKQALSAPGDVVQEEQQDALFTISEMVSFAFDEDGAREGSPMALLPALHYAMLGFSRHVTRSLSDEGHDLQAKSDARFVENAWRALREAFGYNPALSPSQFLSPGFAERKLMLLHDAVELCKRRHNEHARRKRAEETAALLEQQQTALGGARLAAYAAVVGGGLAIGAGVGLHLTTRPESRGGSRPADAAMQCALAALIQATMSLCMAASAGREPARCAAADTSRRATCAYAASMASESRPERQPAPDARAPPRGSRRYLAAPFAAARTVSPSSARARFEATAAAARRTLSRYRAVCRHSTLLSPSYVAFGA